MQLIQNAPSHPLFPANAEYVVSIRYEITRVAMRHDCTTLSLTRVDALLGADEVVTAVLQLSKTTDGKVGLFWRENQEPVHGRRTQAHYASVQGVRPQQGQGNGIYVTAHGHFGRKYALALQRGCTLGGHADLEVTMMCGNA